MIKEKQGDTPSSHPSEHQDGHHEHHSEAEEYLKKIPDYREYKLEDAPVLFKVQKKLKAQGLKDPWIRNYVFMYNPHLQGTPWSRFRGVMFYGFKYGFAAFLLTVVGFKVYDKINPIDHHLEHKKILAEYGIEH